MLSPDDGTGDGEQGEGGEEQPVVPAPTPAKPKITAEQVLTGGPEDGGEDEDEGEGEQPDALDSLTLNDLLSHSKLGPALQSWADTGKSHSDEAVRQQVRGELEAEYEFNQLDAEFRDMTQDEWEELVSSDRKAVDRLARYRSLQSMREGNKNEQQIARSAEVFALATQIATYQELLKGAGLQDDPKLQAANFQRRQDGSPAGRQGVIAWGQAISEALVQKALEERWESYKQDQLAKAERKNGSKSAPVLVDGQKRGGIRLTREVLLNMDMDEVAKLPQDEVDRVLSSLK